MTNTVGEIRPPSPLLFAIESRGILGIARLFAAAPFLAAAPRGEPQPVIVLPGMGGGDRSTLAIRRYLGFLGYQAHGWNRGRNIRPAGADVEPVAAQISALHAATGMRVSLVGWSRGGIIAREASRLAPEAVRMVITLGSPFAAPAATNVMTGWRLITGERFMAASAEQLRRLALPPPVPSTSIFSRGDGVVAWQACQEVDGPNRENVEIRGSHIGLGFNATALWVIADRLAQPLGTWTPFRPGALAAALFPRRRRERASPAGRVSV
jgi:pimeloyl-ACP methyl ester carboxylesterase